MAPDAHWVVVEAISPAGMSVISTGGVQREWTSLKRRAPAIVPIEDLVREVVTHGSTIERTYRPASGRPVRVIVVPITSPRESVYGVQFWCGSEDDIPPPRRRITGVFWDLQRRTVVQPWESTWMSGREDDYHEEVPLARVLQLGTRYDQFAETLQLLFDPKTGQKAQTHVTVVHHKSGKRMCWQVNIVAIPPHGTKVLWEDVTDARPPETPTLHQLGMEEAAARGVNVAVIAPSVGTIAVFLTPPPEWMPWDYHRPGTRVIHPDDQVKMMEFLGSEGFGRSADASREIPVRLLSTSGRYLPVRMGLRPTPGSIGTGIVIATFGNPDAHETLVDD